MRESVTVLHVDDDEEFAALTADYLAVEDDSLDVTTLHDPDAALELLAVDDVDCVVTDLDMGTSDGIELVQRVRERAPGVPCLLFTARNNEALVERALDAGATEYLQKGRPAQFTLLAHRIHTAVSVGSPECGVDAEQPTAERTDAEQPTAGRADAKQATDGGADTVSAGDAVAETTAADVPHDADAGASGPDGVRSPDERIEEVASVVSHDLQNPLTIARGYLERARRDGDEEYFEHVDEALAEIGEIGDAVVTMARLGKRVERFDPIDVESLVRSCWGELEPPEATLVVEEIPTVAGQYNRLFELYECLFENAIRYGSTEDAPVTITVGATETGLFVADDGPGIPEDQREQALEAGYSTEQVRPGLGLSIARAVAEAHGWRLSLGESDAGGLRVDLDGVRFDTEG
ncbi:MAG TPA: hybrid sensor histidine kinase/response regulator [Natronoarchaeum rubrum]|nr:hybrid sensor histidine kinase/response regulator [Natronoarchaeum rubrum]